MKKYFERDLETLTKKPALSQHEQGWNEAIEKVIEKLSDYAVFEKKDVHIIESALNHYWSDANDQLSNGGAIMTDSRRPLGDIEKLQLEQRMKIIKEMMLNFV